MEKEGSADVLYERIKDKIDVTRAQYDNLFDNPRRDLYDYIVKSNTDIEGLLKARKDFYKMLKGSGIYPKLPDYDTFSKAMVSDANVNVVYEDIKNSGITKKDISDLFGSGDFNVIPVPQTYREFEREMKEPEKLKDFRDQLVARGADISYTELKSVFIDGINIRKWNALDKIKSMHIDENIIKNFSIKTKQQAQSRPSPVSPKKQSPKIDIPKQIKEQSQTSQSAYQIEKDRLLGEGWSAAAITNGQMSTCYNFLPQKGDIDNYLEIHVGSSTDVAVKIMDCATNVCVRYVYVHGNSTYKVRNIPPDRYYLKIAYGKEWYSKIENGQCIGRFLRSPLYEKGEEILDFNLKYLDDGYDIPCYAVKLDIISSNRENEFETSTITEDEFNK
jgi:hypothetical protein